MKWIPIDKDNLPQIEVLCINKSREFLLGFLSVDDDEDLWCESTCEALVNPTHYINPKDIEI